MINHCSNYIPGRRRNRIQVDIVVVLLSKPIKLSYEYLRRTVCDDRFSNRSHKKLTTDRYYLIQFTPNRNTYHLKGVWYLYICFTWDNEETFITAVFLCVSKNGIPFFLILIQIPEKDRRKFICVPRFSRKCHVQYCTAFLNLIFEINLWPRNDTRYPTPILGQELLRYVYSFCCLT